MAFMIQRFFYLLPLMFIFTCKNQENPYSIKSKIIIDSLESGKIKKQRIQESYLNRQLLVRISEVNIQEKEDGTENLQFIPEMLDSFFYDTMGFDTIRRNYIYENSWILNHVIKKEYHSNGKLLRIRNERFRAGSYITERINKYRKDGQLKSSARFECGITKQGCDSAFKTICYYKTAGKADSQVLYVWKNRLWKKYRVFVP